MHFQKTILFAGLLLLPGVFVPADLGAEELLKRGGVVGSETDTNRFGLDVSVGVAGIDGFDTSRFALTVTARFELRLFARTRLDLTLPVVWIPDDYPDPWDDPCPPDLEPFCPFGDLFVGLEAEALAVGPSIAVMPSLEWTFREDCCLRPSIFFGVGVWRDGGRATAVPGRGAFTTDDETAPLLTFGAALSRPVTARTSLRLEARAITTFYDEMPVTGPDGSAAELDGGEVTTVILSVGLGLDF